MVLDLNQLYFNKHLLSFFITIFFFTIGLHYFLRNPRKQATLAKAFILLFLVILCANGINRSFQHSETLWAPSPEEELAYINSAHAFVEKGFALNRGLPDRSKSHYDQRKLKLLRVPSSEAPDPFIYTHNPPGPDWLVGLFFKVCGNGTLSCPRILSTITASLALLFFAIMIFYAMGPLKSSVLMFFVAIIPMTRNMIWTLHYHNYAFSIFLIEVAFLLYFFKKKKKFEISTAVILYIISFVQGWFAYEYIFLTILSPIPFALLYSQLDTKADRKRLFFAILFPAIGFCSAIVLHFIQNSIYFGGIMEAFNDIFEIAQTRLLSDKPGGWPIKTDRVFMTLWYFFVFPRSWFFFIIHFPIFLSVCLVLIWFKDIRITIKKPINISLKWVSTRRNYFVILTAFLASYLWIFTMFNEVATEGPHMARILFFFYFICILTILECISLVVPNNQ